MHRRRKRLRTKPGTRTDKDETRTTTDGTRFRNGNGRPQNPAVPRYHLLMHPGIAFVAGAALGAAGFWTLAPGSLPSRSDEGTAAVQDPAGAARENRAFRDEIMRLREEIARRDSQIRIMEGMAGSIEKASLSARQPAAAELSPEMKAAIARNDRDLLFREIRALATQGEPGFRRIAELLDQVNTLNGAFWSRRIMPLALLLAEGGYPEWVISHPDVGEEARIAAYTVLGSRDPSRLLEKLAAEAPVWKDPELLKEALVILGLYDDLRAEKVILEIARNAQDLELQHKVIWTLEEYRSEKSVHLLLEWSCSHPNPLIRSKAKIALLRIAPPATGILIIRTGEASPPGLQPGDLVTHVSGSAITSEDGWDSARNTASGSLTVYRDGELLTIPFSGGLTHLSGNLIARRE